MKSTLFFLAGILLLAQACTDVQGSQQSAVGSQQMAVDSQQVLSRELGMAVSSQQVLSRELGMVVDSHESPIPNPKSQIPNPKSQITNLEFSLEYLMGKFDPGKHPDFVTVDAKYANEPGRYLRKDAYEAFKKMWEAAKADGVQLSIISSTRTFYQQKAIWEAKWTGKRLIENGTNAAKKYPDAKTRALKILEYSSMPGSSRHHWGTDIDLNDLDNYTFEKGPGKKVYDWLKTHAQDYGYCQPFSKKSAEGGRSTGYNEEKWHWSYIPIAQKLTDLASRRLTDDMIGGFKGAETAKDIEVVKNYVLGINQDCL